jgi:hypothetical protein
MVAINTKTFHILNGDALLDIFPPELLTGEIIIARECLVDGPVSGDSLEAFWETRANFIQESYEEERTSYFEEVVTEFDKIKSIPADSEVNFWFEDDLFCQVNLWFCISLLMPVAHAIRVYVIKPPLTGQEPDWRGFGIMDRHTLAEAYLNRQALSLTDLSLLADLWNAYKANDRDKLRQLSLIKSEHFPFLALVIQAQLDRQDSRPERVLRQIMEERQTTDFKTIFQEFGKREGVYGFGDWQVEGLLEKIK